MNSDDFPSSGSVQPKSLNKIWSSPPPRSTPPSAETFEIGEYFPMYMNDFIERVEISDTAVFPRTAIKVEEEQDDFM